MSKKARKCSWFYTAEPVWKQVNKEEFKQFLASYPRHLDVDVTGICDPPLITYNDFTLADCWPYSVVAKTYAYDDSPDDYFYEPEEERFYAVIINHEEMFAGKTRRMANNISENQGMSVRRPHRFIIQTTVLQTMADSSVKKE